VLALRPLNEGWAAQHTRVRVAWQPDGAVTFPQTRVRNSTRHHAYGTPDERYCPVGCDVNV